MEDIVQTISNIFFRPTEFFESVQDETSYTRPWLFFSIGYMIMLFISLAFSIPILLRTPDIVRKVVASGVSSKLITLGDIMTKNLITINKDESIFEASKIMHENKIKRLPVTDGDEVVGIITSTDIVDALSEHNVK